MVIDLLATEAWVGQTFFRKHFTGHLGLATICSLEKLMSLTLFIAMSVICAFLQRYLELELISEGHPHGELHDWRYS